MRKVIACTALAVMGEGHGAELERVIGEGVFGVPWTATVEDVRSLFPDGEIEKLDSSTLYTVRDGRTIFEVERRERDTIMFGFRDDGALISVTVGLKDCASIYPRVIKFFGESDEPYNPDPNRLSTTFSMGLWRDGPFAMSLVVSIGVPDYPDCTLNFGRDAGTVSATAEDLGLN